MRGLGRRGAMRAALAGAAAFAIPGCDPGPTPSVGGNGIWHAPSCGLDEIARSLIDEPSDAFVPLRRWMLEGIAPSRLFEAALSVGARVIPPEGDLHGLLGVHAALLLSSRVVAVDARLPLFKCWNEQHAGVVASRRRGPALPDLDGTRLVADDVPSAEALLIDAWDRWHGDDADAAMLALYVAGGSDAVRGPLTRYGTRNQRWVGHRAIWTAHALRCLDALGWECAPWTLRSLARAIASEEEGNSSGAFAANLARLSSVPAGWQDGADDRARVPELLATLRDGDAETCVDAVIDALAGGLGPRTIWTALALAAVELGVRFQEDSFGVHELDSVNALRHLARETPDRDTALLALLQSAAWRPEFRAHVSTAVIIEEGLDALEPSVGAPPTLDEIFEAMGSSRVDAARMLASYSAAGGTPESVMAVWPDQVVTRTSIDVHQFKYHAALMEELDAALPEWRSPLLIGITRRGPSALSPPWSRHDEAIAILAELDG